MQLRTDGQHRTKRLAEDLFGGGAENQSLQSMSSMCAEDDQVDGVTVDDVIENIPQLAPREDSFVLGIFQREDLEEVWRGSARRRATWSRVRRARAPWQEHGCVGRHR